MQVPHSERRVMPTAQLNPNIISGQQNFQAIDQFNNTLQNANKEVQQRILEMQQQKDTQFVLDKQVEMSKKINNVLYSTESDKDGNPTGILQRKLKNADGSLINFDQQMDTIHQEYLGMMKGENQQRAFEQLYRNAYESTEDIIVKHESQQFQASQDKTDEDNFNQQENDVGLRPDSLEIEIPKAMAIAQIRGQAKGLDQKSIDTVKLGRADRLIVSAINSVLTNGDYKKAQAIYDKNKPSISANTANKIETAIKSASFDGNMEESWINTYSAKDYKLSDDSPDYAKIEANLKTKYAGAEYDKAYGWMRGKASTEERIRLDQQQSQDRSFTNDAVNDFKGGVSYNNALKLAKKYGYDSTDVLTKEEYIRQLYGIKKGGSGSGIDGTDKTISKILVVNLREGIDQGIVSRQQIDDYFLKQNLLTSTDWDSLRNHLSNYKKDGVTAQDTQNNNYLNLKATELYGNDKEQKALFKYNIQPKIKGKSIEEATDIINKQTEATKTGWFGHIEERNWEKYSKLADESNQAWGAYYNIFGGKNIANNIGASLAIVNKRKTTIQDMQSFINNIGGTKVLVAGSPQMKAINYLIANNRPVTPQYIRQIIAAYGSNIP